MSAPDYDVIVIGSGLAGHCAALAALDRGACVLMLESERTVGGASTLSSGMIMAAGTRFQRERGIADNADALFHDYMAINQWKLQPSVVRRLCVEAAPSLEWLADQGVAITDIAASGEELAPRGHVTEGGQAIISALEARLQSYPGIDIALESRVERLTLVGKAVSGVVVGDVAVSAGAVVLACGGIGAAPDLITRYHPTANQEADGVVGYVGPASSRGDAIRLAGTLGAQIIVGRGSRAPASVFATAYLPGFVLIVNQRGRRFHDESTGYAIGEIILADQQGSVAYLLFDDALKRSLRRARDAEPYFKVIVKGLEPGMALWSSDAIDELVSQGEVMKCASLEDLALRICVPFANLSGTVARYNDHVKVGHDADYLKDAKVLRSLATPPFYAAEIRLRSFGVTGAGVRIDHDASVMHETGVSIPGLYAAGECVGNVIGSVYLGSGNALASALTFGRISGASAAAHSGK